MKQRDFNTVAGRLRHLRLLAGYSSAADAAKAMNIPYSSYVSKENGQTGVRADDAARFAKKFKGSLDWLLTGEGTPISSAEADRAEAVQPVGEGLPVIGKVQAGYWFDTSVVDEHPEPEYVPVMRNVRYARARQYALRVVGTSMNLVVEDGNYVTCVDFAESGLELSPGQIVHVDRHRDGGQLVETTIKQVERREGRWFLVPRSSDPKWQPVELNEGEVVVRGIVTGAYFPISASL